MKYGVADYGMNVWDGGVFDYEERWLDLKSIGYQGVERLTSPGEADAVHLAAVMRALVKAGYNGWIFVEHDTHQQDPLKDLAISRQYLREAGF